jgi:arsenite methyltransferase
MSMTNASAEYFERVADKWDDLRADYFTEAVRASAIRKAYLRPEYVVADIGAGTGFMTAGIASLVRQVYMLDASPAMLEAARENLREFNNIVFQEADGSALPLPEASLDVVFANMYLHHCPDPLAAIREMARVLRPGGRLVITDLDAHAYPWLKTEMADVWQGFDRAQIREWYRQAGLVNVIVDCTGESCCAETENPAITDPDERQAQISIFIAVGTSRVLGVKEAVQAGYGAAAESDRGCCPSPPEGQLSACCSGDQLIQLETILEPQFMRDYRPEELAQAPQEAVEISLGCGNPLAFAGLQAGEVVLDIGSGGGMDAFLSARKVGMTGKVIGVDMTPAMLERARRTADRAGLTQVEFRKGQAEALPVEDGVVDVVISNCVINLCEDKGQVFREAYRVLKDGGRLEVSDIVTNQAFSREMAANAADWAGCVYGALPEQEYLDLVAQAGFQKVGVRRSSGTEVVPGVSTYSIIVSARKIMA